MCILVFVHQPEWNAEKHISLGDNLQESRVPAELDDLGFPFCSQFVIVFTRLLADIAKGLAVANQVKRHFASPV